MRNNRVGINTALVAKILNCSKCAAFARISGDSGHENLGGCVLFYDAGGMVLVVADIYGLPNAQDNCRKGIHAIHIHSGGACSGNADNAFADAAGHFTMNDCGHPYHSGDMPPLFSNCGNAWSAFVTSRFTIRDIIGKTVIIHDKPDDFTSQPAGNAGSRIGCGVICKNVQFF